MSEPPVKSFTLLVKAFWDSPGLGIESGKRLIDSNNGKKCKPASLEKMVARGVKEKIEICWGAVVNEVSLTDFEESVANTHLLIRELLQKKELDIKIVAPEFAEAWSAYLTQETPKDNEERENSDDVIEDGAGPGSKGTGNEGGGGGGSPRPEDQEEDKEPAVDVYCRVPELVTGEKYGLVFFLNGEKVREFRIKADHLQMRPLLQLEREDCWVMRSRDVADLAVWHLRYFITDVTHAMSVEEDVVLDDGKHHPDTSDKPVHLFTLHTTPKPEWKRTDYKIDYDLYDGDYVRMFWDADRNFYSACIQLQIPPTPSTGEEVQPLKPTATQLKALAMAFLERTLHDEPIVVQLRDGDPRQNLSFQDMRILANLEPVTIKSLWKQFGSAERLVIYNKETKQETIVVNVAKHQKRRFPTGDHIAAFLGRQATWVGNVDKTANTIERLYALGSDFRRPDGTFPAEILDFYLANKKKYDLWTKEGMPKPAPKKVAKKLSKRDRQIRNLPTETAAEEEEPEVSETLSHGVQGWLTLLLKLEVEEETKLQALVLKAMEGVEAGANEKGVKRLFELDDE